MTELELFKSFLESIKTQDSLINGILEAAEVIDAIGADVNVKRNADISRIQPAIADTIPLVEKAFKAIVGNNYTPTITSGNDGKHKRNSKHYKNLALDWRTRDITTEQAHKVTDIIKKELGDKYFVDFEYPDGPNQHIHIQTRSNGLSPHSEEYYKQEEKRRGQSLVREEIPEEFTGRNALREVAKELEVKPEWLYNLINFESRWNPKAKNPVSSARGLIQFMDSSAKELGYSGSQDLIDKNPTVEQQLAGPVFQYLKKYSPFPTEQSLYMAVFYPKARSWDLTDPFPSRVTKVNPGIYVVGDYVNKVRDRAGQPPVQVAEIQKAREEQVTNPEKAPSILKTANAAGFKTHAPEIMKQARDENISPALTLAFVHNASGYNSDKESPTGREGLMQIRPAIAKKMKIDPSDVKQNVESGTILLKQYKDKFGTDEAAVAAMRSDPSIINDALVDIDRQFAKIEFPKDKWNREGIYKGKMRSDLPPITKSRGRWDLLKQEIEKRGKSGDKLTEFVDNVMKYAKMYDTFAEKYLKNVAA